jgi:hypothetical protein
MWADPLHAAPGTMRGSFGPEKYRRRASAIRGVVCDRNMSLTKLRAKGSLDTARIRRYLAVQNLQISK